MVSDRNRVKSKLAELYRFEQVIIEDDGKGTTGYTDLDPSPEWADKIFGVAEVVQPMWDEFHGSRVEDRQVLAGSGYSATCPFSLVTPSSDLTEEGRDELDNIREAHMEHPFRCSYLFMVRAFKGALTLLQGDMSKRLDESNTFHYHAGNMASSNLATCRFILMIMENAQSGVMDVIMPEAPDGERLPHEELVTKCQKVVQSVALSSNLDLPSWAMDENPLRKPCDQCWQKYVRYNCAVDGCSSTLWFPFEAYIHQHYPSGIPQWDSNQVEDFLGSLPELRKVGLYWVHHSQSCPLPRGRNSMYRGKIQGGRRHWNYAHSEVGGPPRALQCVKTARTKDEDSENYIPGLKFTKNDRKAYLRAYSKHVYKQFRERKQRNALTEEERERYNRKLAANRNRSKAGKKAAESSADENSETGPNGDGMEE